VRADAFGIGEVIRVEVLVHALEADGSDEGLGLVKLHFSARQNDESTIQADFVPGNPLECLTEQFVLEDLAAGHKPSVLGGLVHPLTQQHPARRIVDKEVDGDQRCVPDDRQKNFLGKFVHGLERFVEFEGFDDLDGGFDGIGCSIFGTPVAIRVLAVLQFLEPVGNEGHVG